MNHISDREARVPLELMLASLPGWVKWVWVAMRYLQGPNKYCFANQSTIGEKIVLESGGFMGAPQVCRAQKILTKNGFLTKHKPGTYSCTIPSQIDQDAIYEDPSQIDQDAMKIDQDAMKIDQDAIPSEYQKGVPKGSTKNKKGKTFNSDDWQFQFSETTYQRLETFGARKFNNKSERKKAVAKGAEVFDKIHRLRGYSQDEIKSVMRWLLQADNWWIEKRNFLSPAKLEKKNGEGIRFFELFKIKSDNDHANSDETSTLDSGAFQSPASTASGEVHQGFPRRSGRSSQSNRPGSHSFGEYLRRSGFDESDIRTLTSGDASEVFRIGQTN